MQRYLNKFALSSLLIGAMGLTACQNDKVAKDDVEKIVNARLAEEEAKQLAHDHAALKEENLALKNEVEVLKEELAAAAAMLKPGTTGASKTAAAKKPAPTAKAREKALADLREKLRGGSGSK